METTMRAIEKIQIDEVVHLKQIEGYLPSDSRSRKGWYSFLIKCYKTFEVLSLIQNIFLLEPFQQSLMMLLLLRMVWWLLLMMLALTTPTLLIAQFFHLKEEHSRVQIEDGLGMRKAGSIRGHFPRTIKNAWKECSVRLNNIPISGL